ncbi:MAG: UDP-N-acetylmuramoylalanine--D-glutamate ligase [Alphaproteobacteria bacterium]|jgi:UDP-N-acetylmuramoylalanine--D-glutamate ligase
MIELTSTSGQTYAVMGLGASGIATAAALAQAGAHVLAWDDDATRRDAALKQGVHLTDLGTADIGTAQALVLSPGIPHSFPTPHPLTTRARAAGVPIICDIELLLHANAETHAPVIGITGTNGKSTITALIGHILETAGISCAVGGNLGPAALGLTPQDAKGSYVLELSSYQIERIGTAGFDIAVLVNISPDHLDRHGGMDGYVAAKEYLFTLLRGTNSIAVIGADDTHCRVIADRLRAKGGFKIVPVSAQGPLKGGVYVDGGRVIDATGDSPREIADITTVATLPGRHNWQNAAAATAAALAFGLEPPAIKRALANYPGLAHRQERIKEIDGVLYVNDSKATNPAAALNALHCYDDIFWIAGGLAKDGGFDDLTPGLERIRHAYLIGAAAADMARALKGRVPVTVSGTLDAALGAAHDAAQAYAQTTGAPTTVLLSPACASFDQFANFEARGNAFRALVKGLPEVTAKVDV